VLIERASRVAEAAFAQRRKTLRNSLRAVLPLDAASIDARSTMRPSMAPFAPKSCPPSNSSRSPGA